MSNEPLAGGFTDNPTTEVIFQRPFGIRSDMKALVTLPVGFDHDHDDMSDAVGMGELTWKKTCEICGYPMTFRLVEGGR